MSQFEYVVFPTGIMLGFAIAHLLSGVGKTLFRLTGHGEPIKTSWVHMVWVLNSGFWIFAFWWYTFNQSQLDTWPLSTYLLMIPTPIMMYLQCVMLFPHRFDDVPDVGQYFLDIRKWYYSLFIASTLVDLADGLSGGGREYVLGLGGSMLVIATLSIALPLAGCVTRNLRAQGALGILLLVAQVWQMFNDHPFLGSQLSGGVS